MQNLYSPVQIWSSPLPKRRTLSQSAAALLFCLLACTDPPDPPPTPAPADIPRYSTAPHVRWQGLAGADQTTRLTALFVDAPGGPSDLLAHDADVATFLNDRFYPVFLTPDRAGIDVGVRFVSPRGCLLGPAAQPTSPAEWIETANAAVLREGGVGWGGIVGVGADHRLSGRCEGD